MNLETAADVMALIAADRRMMAVLETVNDLGLPDCWVGAGFVRTKVWDYLSRHATPTPLNDIDVIYFEPVDISTAPERAAKQALHKARPDLPWSVKNQARMHLRNDEASYHSTAHAMEFWLETPTAVALRLDTGGKPELLAPFGIADLLSMTVRPTPKALSSARRLGEYQDRLRHKDWAKHWPALKMIWS